MAKFGSSLFLAWTATAMLLPIEPSDSFCISNPTFLSSRPTLGQRTFHSSTLHAFNTTIDFGASRSFLLEDIEQQIAFSQPVKPSLSSSPVDNEATARGPIEDAAPPPTTATKNQLSRKGKSLPSWGKFINNALRLTLITHADNLHIHAGSGALWFLGSYYHLFSGWSTEFLSNDWSTSTSLSPGLMLTFLSGVTMTLTSLPMLPSSKRFTNYVGQMRNSMMACALMITSSAAFMLGNDLPFPNDMVMTPINVLSQITALLGFITLLYGGIVEGRPWDILPIAEEMKLDLPYDGKGRNTWLFVTVICLSVGWLVMALATMANVLEMLHTPVVGSSLSEGGVETAFAAQIALALAVTPATDALVAGTLAKQDRFNNQRDNRLILVENENKEESFRPARWLEAIQLLLGYPGPVLMTIGAALSHGHGDVVKDFFFLP